MDDPAAQAPIVVERAYRAAIGELWALWTTAEGFASWWGPEGFRVAVHTLDPRSGGTLAYDMIADAPEAIAAMKQMGQPLSHATRGWFDEFDPPHRLTLKHLIDFVSGVEPYESLIEVDFAAAGDLARMIVTIHPHRDPHWTRMSLEGFRSQLTKLDKRFGWSGTGTNMKNIQIIDGAVNATFSLFQATKEEFDAIFPDGRDLELVEDLIERLGEKAAGAALTPLWDRPILKRDAVGIHGTLFYDNERRRGYIPPSKREVDWDSGSVNQAQRDLFAKHR